ncbi:MAG: 23S rRNA (guanosine(2251)-2'-O)-methyltransferase RlmB [Sedimenticola sp.]|nr:23S rRNA (guanosine(2251)-2'-O)-methyltransferase RlmB [Sedimenticola sp.]
MSNSQTVAGLHSVRTALKHGPESILELWVDGARKQDRRVREVIGLARDSRIPLKYVSREQLDEITDGSNHQGVAARTLAPAAQDEQDLLSLLSRLDRPPLLLILDGVQDPHNLGACLRSANATGVDAVIAPKDRSVGLTPTACKVASGAAESIPFIQVTNLVRTLKMLQSEHRVWLIGTAGEAEQSLFGADLTGPVGIVMGGEEKGMRRLTRECCDLLVHLPMAGAVESLNVSVATGVCLYEALRQRSSAA